MTVPLVGRHVDEHAVAEDAGVVDHHVEAAEGVDGGADHRTAVPVRASSPLATASPPMARMASTTSPAGPGTSGAVDLGAEVVDDHLGSLAGRTRGRARGRSPASAGDDDHPASQMPVDLCSSHSDCRFDGHSALPAGSRRPAPCAGDSLRATSAAHARLDFVRCRPVRQYRSTNSTISVRWRPGRISALRFRPLVRDVCWLRDCGGRSRGRHPPGTVDWAMSAPDRLRQ